MDGAEVKRRISFTVLGDAKPAGSKRAFAIRRGGVPTGQIAVTDDNPKSKGWKQDVATTARLTFTGSLLDGPVRIWMAFYRTRPKCHYGASGLSKQGRESVAPTTKPDVLKLARAVEDALTGIVWRDDAQIVDERLTKHWGEPARVEIEIEPLTQGQP
jgi:Holliday junction resolvase RusA-like endonuclease